MNRLKEIYDKVVKARDYINAAPMSPRDKGARAVLDEVLSMLRTEMSKPNEKENNTRRHILAKSWFWKW